MASYWRGGWDTLEALGQDRESSLGEIEHFVCNVGLAAGNAE